LKTKQLVRNAVVAALYVAVTLLFPSFTALQIRISEVFAHLPVFNKKYTVGLLLGVAVANLWSPFAFYDILFGTIHSAVSVSLTLLITKKMKSKTKKMVVNTVVFSLTSFILALMISIVDPSGVAFLPTYISLILSIGIIMAVGIPIMTLLDKRVNFNKQMEKE